MRTALALLVTIVVGGITVSSFATPEKGSIVLGMSAAFTGPSKALGLELYKGAMSCFEQVNREGGIQGNEIVLVAYDDGYNPEPMVRNTIRLVEEDGVVALFGFVGTPTITRMLPLLQRYSSLQMLLLFPFSGAQPLREEPYNEYIFNLRGSYSQETRGLVDKFVAIGRKKIAVFYQVDAYGRSGWEGVRQALGRHGLQISGEATYRRGTTFAESMDRQVAILRDGNPDAIISIGSYAACGAFIRDARQADWMVPIANLSFANTEKMVQQLSSHSLRGDTRLLANLISTQVVPNYEDLTLPAVREYRLAMDRLVNTSPALDQDSVGTDRDYSYISFEGYLNARLLCTVMQQTNDPTDRLALRSAFEALQNVDIGIGATVSFGRGRHQGLDEIYYTTVKDGQVVAMPEGDWARIGR